LEADFPLIEVIAKLKDVIFNYVPAFFQENTIEAIWAGALSAGIVF
jgi:hypothetical protein